MERMEAGKGDCLIPIYINAFNRMTTTKKLAEQCSAIPGANVVIIDNNSTWGPLIDWYDKECQFDVVRLRENRGHHAPWSVMERFGEFEKRWGQSRYIVTDCDLDIGGVPVDVLSVLEIPFSWEIGVKKSGLSLRIDDLPGWQLDVAKWESQFWAKTFDNDDRFYRALIDTTFAMYDRHTPDQIATKVPGVLSARSSPPYTARHVPWYFDCKNLDEENENYFRTSSSSNSWRPSPSQKHLKR